MTDLRPLYVTEKELAARLGFGQDKWHAIRPAYEAAGLPRADPISRLRYWPKVRAFFDRINGHDAPRPADLIEPSSSRVGKENPDALKAQGRRRDRT